MKPAALATELILERLYGVPRISWRTRLKQRIWATKAKLGRWIQYESWGVALAAASLVLIALVHGYYYNYLLMLRQNVKFAWARVEAGEQKRNHVMRNVSELMRFHSRYERDLMKDVTKFRGDKPAENAAAEAAERTQALARLNAVAEAYPNLHLTNTVQGLTTTVVATESEIAAYLISYNENVNVYRTALNTFPTRIFGKILGFHELPFFRPEDSAVLQFKELNL